MSHPSSNSYDEMPYKGQFIPPTHPDRMATMALLHGMSPPPVENCRVLELGCCDGGNLLAIAQTLPNASLLGVDLSSRQVEDGQATLRSLGADNVELRVLDLSDLDESYGLFDYILCHGVYSWVPASVRDKILQICKRNLSPQGVAYVSYNTYPGWGLRGVVRDMMCYHTRGIEDPTARVRQARAVLDFATRSATPRDGPYAQYLREESGKLEKYADAYIFHEFLEDLVQPVYFHEFAAHARSHGLRYLSQATLTPEEATLPAEARQVLDQLGSDLIRREQYLDFAVNRPFRQSLLCHAGVMTYDRPNPAAIRALRLVAMARPENPDPDPNSTGQEPFLTMQGHQRRVDDPLIKAALITLYKMYPRSADLEGLRASCLNLLGRPETAAGADPVAFAVMLMYCHKMQMMNLHTFDPAIAGEPGERPLAGPLARRNAEKNERVISLRSHVAALEEIDRMVLPLLDGSRDRAEIVEALAVAVADGKLNLQSHGKPITDRVEVREALAAIVPASLRRLADEALLIAV